MLYLRRFSLPGQGAEASFLARDSENKRTCYGSRYPFGIFLSRKVPPLTFEPITILCGGNGCGKTTVAKLLTGALRPDSGRVLLDGKPVESLDREAYYASLAHVSCETFLFHDTIRANFLLANPHATEEEMWRALALVRLDGLVRDEQKIFDAMDADETGKYLPFGYRNGAPSPYQKDKRADSAKLSRIQLHLDDLVTQMGEQLYGGQIDAEPLVVSSSKSPCTWCDYSFICCHETGVHERALEAPAKPFEPEEEPEEEEEQP